MVLKGKGRKFVLGTKDFRVENGPSQQNVSSWQSLVNYIRGLLIASFVPDEAAVGGLHPFYKSYALWMAVSNGLAYCSNALASGSLITMLSSPTSAADDVNTPKCLPRIPFGQAFTIWLLRELLGQVGGILGMGMFVKVPDSANKTATMWGKLFLVGGSLIEVVTFGWLDRKPTLASGPLYNTRSLNQSRWEWAWWYGKLALVGLSTGVARNVGFMLIGAARAHQIPWQCGSGASAMGTMYSAAAVQTTIASVLGTLSLLLLSLLINFHNSRALSIGTVLVLSIGSLGCARWALKYAYSPVPTRSQLTRFLTKPMSPESFSMSEIVRLRFLFTQKERVGGVLLEPSALPEYLVSLPMLQQARREGYLLLTQGNTKAIWLVRGASSRKHLVGLADATGVPCDFEAFARLGWKIDAANFTGPHSLAIIDEEPPLNTAISDTPTKPAKKINEGTAEESKDSKPKVPLRSKKAPSSN